MADYSPVEDRSPSGARPVPTILQLDEPQLPASDGIGTALPEQQNFSEPPLLSPPSVGVKRAALPQIRHNTDASAPAEGEGAAKDSSHGADQLRAAVATAVKKLGQEVEKLSGLIPSSPLLDEDGLGTNCPVFDHFLIVGLDGESDVPSVLYHHSAPGRPELNDELRGRVDLPEFCFPCGISRRQVRRTKSDSDLSQFMFGHNEPDNPADSHVFQFSGLAGNLYGVCVYNQELLEDGPSFLEPTFSYPPPKSHKLQAARRCYCFLTRVPVLPLLFSALYTLLDRGRLLKVSLFAVVEPEVRLQLTVAEKKAAIQMLNHLSTTVLPYQGGDLTLKPFEDMDPIQCSLSPYSHSDLTPLLANYGVHILLGSLSLNSFLFVFMSVLLERRVVFVCDCPGLLSAALLSLVSLLRPLAWQSMFVPILPVKMHHFLDAPVPYLVGVVEIADAWKPKVHDAVYVHLLEDRVEGWNLLAKRCQLPSEGHLRKLLAPCIGNPLSRKQLLQMRLFRVPPELAAKSTAASNLLTEYTRSIICRGHQWNFLRDNQFSTLRCSPSEADFLETLASSRMMTSFFEEGKAWGSTTLGRTAGAACRVISSQRTALAAAHGGLDMEEAADSTPGSARSTSLSPISGLELQKEDSFLRQLAKIERGDVGPKGATQNRMSRSLRKASRRTNSAVSEYTDYITQISNSSAAEAEQPDSAY
eukprot:TRINITY_DN60251_c0_g2_i2.p1 TRINITY_DN60251_c0_g2~~TRINITY_DN60251_c0_g2_i2.p1  ORF type:complete len:700 (-),score=144.80 TRINITY_DN60251_c0_g2_i2:286-2385(-)